VPPVEDDEDEASLDSPDESSTSSDTASSPSSLLPTEPLRGPPPPKDELPVRFLRAGGNSTREGWRRYRATLRWRRDESVDSILREPCPDFSLIKRHYPHCYHLTGRRGEPVSYERPAGTDLKALRAAGIGLKQVLRHYTMITEFQWQVSAGNLRGKANKGLLSVLAGRLAFSSTPTDPPSFLLLTSFPHLAVSLP